MASITHKSRTYQLGEVEPAPLPDWLPTVLPVSWRLTRDTWPGAPMDPSYARVYRKSTGLLALMSAARYNDGKAWLHASVSRSDGKLPSWQDMSEVKNTLIGPDHTALQVMPPKSKYVNIHPGVLHLWVCLEGNVVPDFTGGGESI